MVGQIVEQIQGVEIRGSARQVRGGFGDACFSFCGWHWKSPIRDSPRPTSPGRSALVSTREPGDLGGGHFVPADRSALLCFR
ncbi:hypothetical protein C791_2072 [Amycolatopsis azurea DSM 43854]|uniref:Uncharacterized protein n=1 Tax=Amycolatopsis azurea DSM 43854 TaxID=1238180 RepID=M2Q719_9PSEU|nr:hypothetical protein C791_2072 [Amycolatopsis azurea DSM 43854]